MKIFRQGDVLLRKVDKKIKDAQSVGLEYVVALGEKTGHKHVLTSKGDIKVSGVFGEQLNLILSEDATLTHDEHGPITLDAGTYEVVAERELDHAKDSAQQAID